jgi:GT2 family glycosyltransferase
MADVRVGIVSWNTAALLDRCLRALPAGLGDLDAEVVVVDNASSDESVAVACSYPAMKVVRNPENRGYARAMNQALAGTDAPVLIALNPDTEPPPGSLAALVERLSMHPEAGLVAPRLVDPDGTLQHSVYRFPSPTVAAVVCFVPLRFQHGWIGRRWWLEGSAPHDRSTEVDWAIGAVHVIRSASVAPDPPYSERWFMYVEDIELCWRLHQAGWTVRFESDVTVPHVGNAAGEQAWGRERANIYWRATYEFYRIARGRARARLLGMANTVGSAWLISVASLRSFLPGSATTRSQRRVFARELAGVLPVHIEATVRAGSSSSDRLPRSARP